MSSGWVMSIHVSAASSSSEYPRNPHIAGLTWRNRPSRLPRTMAIGAWSKALRNLTSAASSSSSIVSWLATTASIRGNQSEKPTANAKNPARKPITFSRYASALVSPMRTYRLRLSKLSVMSTTLPRVTSPKPATTNHHPRCEVSCPRRPNQTKKIRMPATATARIDSRTTSNMVCSSLRPKSLADGIGRFL